MISASGTEAYVKNILYNEHGQRTEIDYGNNVVTKYAYDDENLRLKTIETTKGGRTIQSLTYDYDDTGNVTRRSNDGFQTKDDNRKFAEHNYEYDSLNRLVKAKGSYTRSGLIIDNMLQKYDTKYDYTPGGNISRKKQSAWGVGTEGNSITDVNLSYDNEYKYDSPKPHAVTKVGSTEYTYDLDGRMTGSYDSSSKFKRTFTWDEEGRLLKTVDNKHTTDYRYDSNGERICKYSDLGETIYASGYYTETDGKKISKHIYIGSTRVASQVMSRTCETSTTMKRENTLYYHTDHLGSSGYVTDKKGEFYEHTEYTSSGESWVNEKVTGNANLPYKYCLKEMDNETGLYYYGARYYDAKMSRFISADDRFDDLFSTQSMDIFAYCRNNPIIYIDPDGHAPIQDEKTQKIVTAEIDVSKYEDLKDLGDSNERALTVECTIESNIRNSSGRVIGMKGQQKITYIKSDGKKIEQTLENVIWQEDARVENPQYPYEMPAEPEDGFEIRKNNTSSFDDYPILTTHSETGICVHRDGRSEGCFLFDINKPEGAEALDDLHNRTVNQGEVLRGKVTCVTDKRTAAERRAAPVYYLNDPNYIIDTGD